MLYADIPLDSDGLASSSSSNMSASSSPSSNMASSSMSPSEVIEMVLATTDTISPMPPMLRNGVIAIAVLSLLSFLSCAVLFLYITYRVFKPRWQQRRGIAGGTNTHHLDLPGSAADDADDRRHEDFVTELSLSASKRQLHHADMKKPAAEARWHRPSSSSPQAREGGLGSGSGGRGVAAGVERPASNPFLTLIHNLLIADIIQSFALTLDMVWWAHDGIFVGSSTCAAQAFFVDLGALSISVFLIGISLNTYLTIVWGVKLSRLAVRSMVIFNWVFSFTLAFVGLGSSNSSSAGGEIFYARSVAICWINRPYATTYGLWLQNFWLVASMGVTVACYAWILVALLRHKRLSREMPQRGGAGRRSSRRDRVRDVEDGGRHGHGHHGHHSHGHGHHGHHGASSSVGAGSLREPSGHHPAFLVYPIVYILSSGPITVVGLVSSAGVRIDLPWFLFVTALCSLAGLLDAVLWSTTIVFSSSDDLRATGLETYDFMRTPSRIYGNMVWVEGGGKSGIGGGRGRGDEGLQNDRKWWRLAGGEDASSGGGGGGGGAGARPVDDNAILMDTVTSVTVDVVDPGRNTSSTIDDYSPPGST